VILPPFVGPQAGKGALPALFYFALSAEESLFQDPFNQPVMALQSDSLRIFSFSLPFHGEGMKADDALTHWAKTMEQGEPLLEDFFAYACNVIENLIEEGIVLKDKIAIAGLSRGAFVATHIATRIDAIQTILGFSPLTKLSCCKEFIHFPHQELDLETLAPRLVGKKLRYYIGNHDTRVSTRSCFEFIEKLVTKSSIERIRSAPVELNLFPSIGRHGHGTPPEIFKDGARWIKERLL